MRVEFFFVKKYLLARKTSLSINIITIITMLGLAIGTASLIIVLSVFNGFEELLSGMFSKYNPDIKIEHSVNNHFYEDQRILDSIRNFPEVAIVSKVYEQNCMFQYGEAQDFGTIRGIDRFYPQMIALDSAKIEGSLVQQENEHWFAYIGVGLSNRLGISTDNYLASMNVYTPTMEDGRLEFSESNFRRLTIQPKMIYSFHQESDYEMVMTDLDDLRSYLKDTLALTSIQLKLTEGRFSNVVVNKLSRLLGSDYVIKDRYRQDEAFIKIMNLEKWLFFTLFVLTLVLVSFTMVGTLWMIVLEKRLDISILKSLGMISKEIQSVFYGLGLSIGAIGMFLGFALALLFYYLQTNYSIIKVPEEFIIQSYPIALRMKDFLIVSAAVMTIVLLACVLPTQKINEVEAIFREE